MTDEIESEEFYNLMQTYRRLATEDPDEVLAAYDAVKEYIARWMAEQMGARLESQGFYEAMHTYRHVPLTNQPATIMAYEDVKRFIRGEAPDVVGEVAKATTIGPFGDEPK